jgi:hypothetical protein
MKTGLAIISPIILILCCIYLTSCFEEVKPGVKTTVKGTITDPVKNKVLRGAKVVVLGCQFYIDGGTRCGKFIDSTSTDSQGEYQIDFTSDGTQIGYFVEFMPDENFVPLSVTGAPDAHSRTTILLTPGKVNAVSFQARELNFLKARVQIDSNSLGDLHFYAGSFYDPYGQNTIYQSTRDTMVVSRIVPAFTNFYRFDVLNSNRYRYHYEVIEAGMQDTVRAEITISNPGKWPLQ